MTLSAPPSLVAAMSLAVAVAALATIWALPTAMKWVAWVCAPVIDWLAVMVWSDPLAPVAVMLLLTARAAKLAVPGVYCSTAPPSASTVAELVWVTDALTAAPSEPSPWVLARAVALVETSPASPADASIWLLARMRGLVAS